jgi:GAF domain-containing protein
MLWRGQLAAGLIVLAELFTVGALLAGVRVTQLPGWLRLSGQGLGFALVLVWAALWLINRRGYTALAGIGLALAALGLALAVVAGAGPLTPHAITLVLPVILAGLFGPPISSIAAAVLAGVGYATVNLQASTTYPGDLIEDWPTAQYFVVYASLSIAAVVSWLFARTSQQVIEKTQETGMALVAQRDRLSAQLVSQTRQLQATVSVARSIAGSRDLDALLEDAVRLVQETFGYYHVQVFLTDSEQGYAVLRQSTGSVGKALLARGHRLAVGSLSVIGQVTATGRPVVARDTDADAVHRRNELLPNTRSEMALPLKVGEEVIGALDLQSEAPDAFDPQAVPALEALADLLAIAIQNARLFEQAEASLRELRVLGHEVTRGGWAGFLAGMSSEQRLQTYGPDSTALQVQRSRIVEQALRAGSVLVSTGSDGRPAFLAAPIVVRNEVIGVLGVEPDGTREWTQDDLQILEAIADRTALAVENARLYIQTQQVAERERLVNAIAARMQRAPSLALLLESATRELASALGTDQVYAEINLEQPVVRQRRMIAAPEADRPAETSPAGELAAPNDSGGARAE